MKTKSRISPFVIVNQSDSCQVCQGRKATVDQKTMAGPWAYMCNDCSKRFGIGKATNLKEITK